MERKEFFETIPLGVCVVERPPVDFRVTFKANSKGDFKVVYANHPFFYLLQSKDFLSPYDLTGRRLADIWKNKKIDDLVRRLKKANPPRDFALPIAPAEDGLPRWAKISISEGDYEGRPVYILWVIDISASKETEVRLEQAVRDADALAQAKSNFLATMSHEIRTPMQSIYGFLELIGEEKPPAGIQTMVDTAKKSASGLLEILDDILDLAKIEADQMELDHFEVPVRTLVRGMIEALAVKVHGKNVQILDDIEQDVPFVVEGDPKRLRQILMNLTGNALKFTEQGSVTVHVARRTRHLHPAKGRLALRFEIRDTGIGMSEEVRSRLFKPFSQADNSTSRKYGGTGLGLSISKRLVELMGGQIGVDSTPGKGSVFWFEIPTEEVSTDKAATDLPSLDGLSVLSVEDHPQGAREIVKSLQSMGASVESCASCKEARDLVHRRPFDVAVVDQGLPDGLGLDLIRDIMKIRPSMGLIMYTVRDDIGLQHSLQALGVAYLAKPASRLGLGTAVKDAARKQTRMVTGGTRRLLIAEDNETVHEVLRRQLEKLGVGADFVDNGRKALDALASREYSIVFTDLHMPEIDGYALVRTLREREADPAYNGERLPVIVLTADVQMAQRQVYLAEGFDECLLKPVSLGQLRRLLIRWGILEEKAENEQEPAAPRTAATPESAPVNIPMLMEQMGADRADAVEMLSLFVEMTEPLVGNLSALADTHDIDALREAAHSLKGAARSACCVPLGDLAAQLQDACDERREDPKLVAALGQAFADVKDALKTL